MCWNQFSTFLQRNLIWLIVLEKVVLGLIILICFFILLFSFFNYSLYSIDNLIKHIQKFHRFWKIKRMMYLKKHFIMQIIKDLTQQLSIHFRNSHYFLLGSIKIFIFPKFKIFQVSLTISLFLLHFINAVLFQ